MDFQNEMTKASVHRESPKPSKSALHSVLSNGSFYGQDSWEEPEGPAFNKIPSKLTIPTLLPIKNPPSQRDSTVPSFKNSHNPVSVRGGFSPSQQSSISSYSSQMTLIGLRVPTGHQEGQKEKITKFKQMYKRASMSTKALARMFSRSPRPGRGSPTGGVSKRSSLKTPIPFIPPPKELLDVDPFASGSSASSYGLSPLGTTRLSLTHKRAGSSPEIKPPTSVEIQKQLKRSPSVSSPAGIPSSPLWTLPTQQSQQSSTRGRDSPFPVNSSNLSLPLSALRTSPSTQSLISSMGTQATIPRSSQHQVRPPVSRMHSNGSLRAQVRQTPPHPAPEQPPPAAPSSLPYLTPAGANSSEQGSNFIQRLRSKSVRETKRPRPTLTVNESSSQRSVHKLDMSHDNKQSLINRGTSPFLGVPPSGRLQVGPTASVRAPEVHVVAPSPSVPSMRATFLASDPMYMDGRPERISPAGFISVEGERGNLDSSSNIDSRTAETPGKGLELDRLPEPIPQLRTRRAESSRDPSPMRAAIPPETVRKPSLPLLVTQNLPSGEDSEASSTNLRPHHSTRHIPRSPSMPSLRPDFINTPPMMQTPGSHSKKSKTRFGTLDDSHIRSPSLPDVVLNATSSGSSLLDKEKRQPLPSSITERLKSRARSYTKSEGHQPHGHSLPSKPPPPPSVTKSLEPLPPALADGPVLSRTGLEKSALPAAPGVQVPPPPKVSELLKLRVVSRPQGSSLRTPSMPNLRENSSTRGNRSRRAESPPPLLPSTQNHATLAHPRADIHTGRLQGPTTSAYNSLSTASSRPMINLTRSNESLSYPPFPHTLHANSNNGVAKEGGWNALSTPPRLLKSPKVQTLPTHLNRKLSHVGLRSRSNSVKRIGSSVPPVAATQVQRNDAWNRMVGVAL